MFIQSVLLRGKQLSICAKLVPDVHFRIMNRPEDSPGLKQRKKQKFEPYMVRIGGKTMWQVNLESETLLRDGRRVRVRPRRTFSSVEEPRSFAALKRIERKNRGTLGVSMPEKLRADALEAARLLEP